MVFDAHERAFAFFRGACARGIYDNMKTAVETIFIGKDRQYNRRFLQMCSHHLVEPVACTPASGWEKGQVENQVGLVRERFFTLRVTLADVYDADYLATMLLERYSKIIHVNDFARQIDESIKAFFSGYRLVAVLAMVPVIEGIVRKMATRQNRDVGNGTKKLNDEFDVLVERERASPYCYGERLVMLEVLREFIRARFLEKTDTYNGLNDFNRHGILHGIYDQYGDELNFFRLITMLDLLCFSIGLIEGGVSCFAPEMTRVSSHLAQHYQWLQHKVAPAK